MCGLSSEPSVPPTDSLHPFGTHIDWNESFYFNFYDRAADTAGFMRIGLKPNKNEKSMLCFLMMPDGTSMGVREVGPFDTTDLRIGGLSFLRIKPDKEWLLEWSGPMKHAVGAQTARRNVNFKLRYTALNEVFDYRECVKGTLEEVASVAAADHTEQFGRLSGELTIDGEVLKIDALGERDHSWGVRDWIAPSMWIWLSCQFSERMAFNITKLFVGHEVVDAGFIHVDGENRPITKVAVATVYDDGGGPKSIAIVLQEKDGRTHEVTAEALREKKLPFGTEAERHLSIMHEALARYRMGDMLGYGIAEYLVRVR